MADAEDTKKADADDAFITTALERFKLGVEARKDQRERETDALKFQVPALQWPDGVKTSRGAQVIKGIAIPERPMLSIPSLDQPIQLVLNQEKAAQLGVQIHPLSEDADDDTAEVLQGLYRRIEVDSRANLARSFGFERGAKAGTGEYEVVTEYDEEGGSKFDQRIVIKRILYQGSVVRDPFAQEPDWSDAMWAFKTSALQWDTYKRKYPKSKLASYTDDELDTLSGEEPGWITDEGAARAVRIAAYYEIRITKKTVVLLDDGSEAFDDEIPAGRKALTGPQAKSRECDHRALWYSVINAVEVLEEAQEQNGKYIPLIPCIGRELVPFDDERRWVGIIEPNMDAARLINYAASSLVEMAALETKAPYMLAEGQEEGHEAEFGLSNVRNFPYLRYKPVSLLGQPVPPPARTQVDASRLGPSMMLLDQGRNFLHEGTGAFAPTLGQESNKDRSGKAVLALQQQHDQGSSHFLDNLAEITLTYEAKVVLDLIPHIYDRPGRVARILDKEDNPKTVMLNAPFVMNPQTQRPMPAPPPGPQGPGAPMAGPQGQPLPQPPPPGPQGPPMGGPPANGNGNGQPPPMAGPAPPKVLHYDLKKGRYGVTVNIGKSYKSRIEEGSDGLSQLFQAEPQLFQILGDLWLKFQTWPGHIEAAERVKKMLPGPLQEKEGGAQAEQQVAQMKQQMEQMQQQLQQAAEMIKTKQVEHQAKIEVEKISSAMQLELQKMKDATAIAVAEINARAKGVVSAQEAAHEAAALHEELAHDATQYEQDRQHEAALTTMQHAQGLEAGQQGAVTDATMAAQQQQHALEQGQAGHDQAIAQQEQAAALAPPPPPGA